MWEKSISLGHTKGILFFFFFFFFCLSFFKKKEKKKEKEKKEGKMRKHFHYLSPLCLLCCYLKEMFLDIILQVLLLVGVGMMTLLWLRYGHKISIIFVGTKIIHLQFLKF